MAGNPQQIADGTQAIIDAWEELVPTATFAGMTLAQFQAAVQPSFDTRKKIGELEIDLKAQMDARDKVDVPTAQTNADVVKAVVADKNFGDDSACMRKWVTCAKASARADSRAKPRRLQQRRNNRNQRSVRNKHAGSGRNDPAFSFIARPDACK
jgi:hypothetical protein